MRTFILASILALALAGGTHAQDKSIAFEYIPTGEKPAAGSAPGLKATELAPRTRTFHIVICKGDDVAAGLADFAEKNHLTNAHFLVIVAFGSALIGWACRLKKAFKVVKLNKKIIVASFLNS